MKTTAIVLGGLTQAVAFAVLLVVVQPPQLVYLSAPAVGGVVGALASDRFQSEYVDAGGAGVVGTLLSLEVVMVTAWPNTVSLPPDLRIDVTFLTLLFGVGALILIIPITVLASAVVGHVTVIVWEMQTTS
jgi:hypothetical protein